MPLKIKTTTQISKLLNIKGFEKALFAIVGLALNDEISYPHNTHTLFRLMRIDV